MNTKRVLLVGPFPPPVGGDTVLTLNLAKSECWKRHGIEIECVDTSPGDRVRVPDERLVLKDVMRGGRIFREFASSLPRCRAVLLWANGRFILTEGLAIVAHARLSGKPVFVKAFGGFLGQRIRTAPRARRVLATAVLRKATFILPETRALVRELVEEAGFSRERVRFLPNFLPESSFVPNLAPKRFTGACVFFGQIKREKGVFDIIEAIGGAPRVRCDFYGPLLDRDRDDFLGALSRHSNLAYRGLAEPGTVSRIASTYDVLLLPTYHLSEGYPGVILEAFAGGIPVIATRWLSLAEIVEDGARGFLVEVRSPDRIREALGKLAASPESYESMRRNAFAYVKSFSERFVVEETLVPLVVASLGR